MRNEGVREGNEFLNERTDVSAWERKVVGGVGGEARWL